MDEPDFFLYKTRMADTTSTSVFFEDHHYFPAAGWTRSCFTILRAGKVGAAPDYAISRPSYPGQDLLFCVSGAGFILSEGERYAVGPNQLAWIANERPHAHWADPDRPWTVLWVRLDGPDNQACRSALFGPNRPVVTPPQPAGAVAWFEQLFEVFRSRSTGIDAVLNRLVAEMLVLIEESQRGLDGSPLPHSLLRAVDGMRANPERRWNAADLARESNVSAPHLRRLFRRHLQSSPRQWLMRERLLLVQTLLLDTNLRISEIAERSGFSDVYHLSREFKRAIGINPSRWRRLERG